MVKSDKNRSNFVTLKDIAKLLGISTNAVSKALRNCDDISTRTKEQVKNCALELGYIPNYEALSLKNGFSNTIAVILNDLLNPYFAIFAQQITNKITSMGYKTTILYCQTHLLDFCSLQTVLNNKFCAIVSLVEPTDDVIKFYHNRQIPFLLIGIKIESKIVDDFYTDDTKGGRLVAEYFLNSSNCKKALYISNSMSETSYRRYNGFSEILSKSDKPFQIIPYQTQDDIIKKAYNKIKDEDFDFIFCYSDYLAIKLKRYLENNNFKKKVTIFGFDNLSDKYDLIEPVNSIAANTPQIIDDVCNVLQSKISKRTNIDQYIEKKYDVSLIIKN